MGREGGDPGIAERRHDTLFGLARHLYSFRPRKLKRMSLPAGAVTVAVMFPDLIVFNFRIS